MRREAILTAALLVGVLLAAVYVTVGIIGWIVDVDDGDNGDLAIWLLLLVGGGALLLVGLFAVSRWSTLSVALGALGALAGALALWWTFAIPLIALGFVVLAVVARRQPAGPGP